MSLKPSRWGRGVFSSTGVGTNAGVTVTHAPATGTVRQWVSGVQCSGDAAAIVTIESPVGTVLYRKRFAAAFTLSESFVTPKKGAEVTATANSGDVLVKISASTSNSEANIDGWEE